MSVYVDSLHDWGWRIRGRCVRSCHLIADTQEELHEFALRIGLKRSAFQSQSSPHYDLTARRRKRAVELGAVELDRSAFVSKLREIRTVVLEGQGGSDE